ncbi:hypothetical protein J7S33_31865, partial [Saccharothrix algeriensis]
MTDVVKSEPLWDAAGFSAFLTGLAEDDAPRLFAVAVEYGERHDGYIAAYGMAFPDSADVINREGDLRLHLQAPEDALKYFMDHDLCEKARIVWLSGPGTRIRASSRPSKS